MIGVMQKKLTEEINRQDFGGHRTFGGNFEEPDPFGL
jgi:hypothetical protein